MTSVSLKYDYDMADRTAGARLMADADIASCRHNYVLLNTLLHIGPSSCTSAHVNPALAH